MKENSREEDRKILEKLINTMKSDRELFDEKIDKEIYAFFINALEHILSDYKRVLKENKELEADNYELNNRINDLLDNIPIQKVKDKIEELEKRKQEYEEENTIDEDYFFDINGYNSAIFVLQELIDRRTKDNEK